jgi:hypothetical protein
MRTCTGFRRSVAACAGILAVFVAADRAQAEDDVDSPHYDFKVPPQQEPLPRFKPRPVWPSEPSYRFKLSPDTEELFPEDDHTVPRYRFKLPPSMEESAPIPEEQAVSPPEPKYRFKTPPVTEEPLPDFEEHPLKAADPNKVLLPYTYPMFKISVGYRPEYYGLNDTLQLGTPTTPLGEADFSYSQFVPLAAGVKVSGDFTSRFRMDVELSYAKFTATPKILPPLFSLDASSTNILTATITPYYCFRPGTSLVRFCSGLGVGLDSFPVLNVLDNAGDLVIDSFSDMIVRLTEKVIIPLVGTTTLGTLEVGYDKGVLHGNSGDIHVNSHYTAWGAVGFETPLTFKTDFVGGIAIQDKNSNFVDLGSTYAASALLYQLNAGVRWNL